MTDETLESTPSPGEILSRHIAGESLDEIVKKEDDDEKRESAPPSDESHDTPPSDDESHLEPKSKTEDESPKVKIDYKQEIPMHGRDAMPLSDVKDAASKWFEHQDNRVEIEEQDRQKRVSLYNQERDSNSYLSFLAESGQLTQEQMGQWQQRATQLAQRNLEAATTLIPEWSKPETITSDQQAIIEWAAQYNILPERAGAFVYDDPAVAFAIRDTAIHWKKMQEILKEKKTAPKHSKPKGKRVAQPKTERKGRATLNDHKRDLGERFRGALNGNRSNA